MVTHPGAAAQFHLGKAVRGAVSNSRSPREYEFATDRSGAAGNHSRIAIRVTIRRPGMRRSGLYIGLPSQSWRGRVGFYPGSGSVLRTIKLTLHAHISVPSEPIGDMAWHPGKTRAVGPHDHLFLYFPESSGAP